MNKTLLDAGLYLIAQADDNTSTEAISQAIVELEKIKHIRENIPF